MNLFPYDKIFFVTDQEIDTIKVRLVEKTEYWQNQMLRARRDRKYNRYSDPSKFELKSKENNFTLRRINDRYSNNGLRPIVKGCLKKEKNKTFISLTIRQHTSTIFVLLFLTFVTLSLSLITWRTNFIFALTSFLFFIIVYCFFLIGYNVEIKQYKKFLIDTFQ